MSIRLKLTALAVVLTLITAGVVGVASYRILEQALIDAAFARLVTVRENQNRALQTEFSRIEQSLAAITYAPAMAPLARELRVAWSESAPDDRQFAAWLREAYAGVGRSQPASSAEQTPPHLYGTALAEADRVLRRPAEVLGFEELYLVLPDGFVAYSTRRRSDFARFVGEGDLRDSGLHRAVGRVLKTGRITVTSPDAYLPVDNAQMIFVAFPVSDGDSLLGVLVGRVDVRCVTRLLDDSVGLGASGEAYLVGPDQVTRGSSRTSDSPVVMRNLIDTPLARDALAGRTGRRIAADYRGVPTLAVYRPFEYRTVTLGLVAEVSEAEILAPLRAIAIDVLQLVAGVALVMAFLGLLMAQGLARPLVRLSAAVQAFGQTRQLTSLPYTRRRDEIGTIARVVAEAGAEIEGYLVKQAAAQAALQRSEAQFKAVVDQLPSGIALRDDGGGYLFINERQRRWFNVDSPFEILGAQPSELFDAETVAALDALEAQVRAGEVVREKELTIAWPDGERRTMLLTKFPLMTENGELLAIGTVVTDISAIRQAEGEIRRAEADLRLALTYLPGGIYKTGPDERVQLFNENWKLLLGYPDELAQIGVPREKLRAFRQARGDVLKTSAGEISLEDAEYLRAEVEDVDGMLATEELVGDRILEVIRTKTPDGGIVGVVRDTTKRRLAEEALAKSEERFRAIVDQLPNAVIVKDVEGRYELINRAYCDWYGIDAPEDAVGKTAEAFVPPDVYAIVANLERQIVNHRTAMRAELLTRFADATEHSLITSQFPLLAPDGTMFGMGTVLTDITEQKQAQQRLAHALGQVRESVDYAGRIQRALLPDPVFLERMLGEHFVIWEPKDGVGGDLLWARSDDRGGITVCLFDCTGHGVPGALMTTIAIAALNNAFEENPDPAALIAGVNRRIKEALRQADDEDVGASDDGLEMGVCWLPSEGGWLIYAGARFSLVVMRDGAVDVVPGDRSGVGYRRVAADQAFTNQHVSYAPGTSIYMFTDGMTDQIGGDKRRAFGRKRVLEILQSHSACPMVEQRDTVLSAFHDFQGDEPRRDDVSMVGIRLVR